MRLNSKCHATSVQKPNTSAPKHKNRRVSADRAYKTKICFIMSVQNTATVAWPGFRMRISDRQAYCVVQGDPDNQAACHSGSDWWLVKATNYCLTSGDIQLKTPALEMALRV